MRRWLPTLGLLLCRPLAGRVLICLILSAVLGCGSAGPYGYSRVYTPLSGEEDAAKDSERYDPVMAQRLPQEWRGKKLDVFAVVLGRGEGRDGLTDLTLSVRRLAARNLCEAGEEESCRVTVGDQELARLHALVKLRKEDEVGDQRLQARSLVRVIGKLEDQVNKDDGADVLLASYYRHWPPATYVTEQARSYMRR
jgi:hypothetical protein